MKRNIGAELAARMTHLNEMLANGESVGAIRRADVDSSQPVALTAEKREGEPTDEQIRLFTERLLAMGGVPGRFWP